MNHAGQAWIVRMGLALWLLCGAAALGGVDGFDLSWNTIDCGGATFSTGASYELGGTVGQHDASTLTIGGEFEILGGFWPGASAAPIDPCPADISGDGIINVADLLLVIGSWGAGAGSPADINDDGVVNVVDLLAVISAWGACP
ncbi:MAG: hypothetical protein L0Y44_14400 [Phycisphaerales bacterium]|nr:hypothetical protein [Phycisphaerales bacterium]MCI0631834.1 hypothetical protein [Phycisphaerales bacterium]MCI0674556.1 hypothetical protein [Phycisphaerales bacterium]